MKILVSLAAVGLLFLVGLLGGLGRAGEVVFGVLIPYPALVVFLGGLIYRVLSWAKAPVPFRITTTCGQEKSLPWIKQAKIDNPSGLPGVVIRMALEVLVFRSLLRNTKAKLYPAENRLAYGTSLGLWAAAMAFHWSMLVILIRHLRLALSPVPAVVTFVEKADGLLETGVPVFFVTTILFLAALVFLLGRRLLDPQVRYISLVDDYFPLLLLLGIGLSGFWLRHFAKADVVGIKELVVGLASFHPVLPAAIHPLFFGHLFLVSMLLIYFPFGKLVHMPGVFLSPTRNLANNNRRVRHVNPWDYPVKTHPYPEYEDEWREKMKAAGLPVEKA